MIGGKGSSRSDCPRAPSLESTVNELQTFPPKDLSAFKRQNPLTPQVAQLFYMDRKKNTYLAFAVLKSITDIPKRQKLSKLTSSRIGKAKYIYKL